MLTAYSRYARTYTSTKSIYRRYRRAFTGETLARLKDPANELMDSVQPVDLTGVPGVTRAGSWPQYTLRFQTRPDHQVVEFVPGVGLTHYIYVHHGTVAKADVLIGQYRDRPPAEWARAKRIFNILADRVETVAPWLAARVLTNIKTGVRIKWLTRSKIIGRFLAAPFRKSESPQNWTRRPRLFKLKVSSRALF